LTRDHSLVDELVRQGKHSPEEALEHPQRSVITRAVGPEARVEVDTETWQAKPGDVYLICSDGLTTMVDEAAIQRTLEAGSSLEEAGRALIDAANDAGGRDNITVILFRLEEIAGAGQAEEQDTMAGATALTTSDVQAAIEADGRRAPVATADRSDPADPVTTVSRKLAPVEPTATDAPKRDRKWPRRALVIFAVVGFLIVPIALGTFVAVRSVYFVGADDQGFVTVYRGLPYDLPLGVELYQVNYRSGVHRDQVPGNRRDQVLDQEWRSQDDAYDLVRQLERGELS
jgi:protein phosphatase